MLKIFVRLYIGIPVILIIVTVFLVANARKKMTTYSECVGTIVGFSENATHLRNDSDNNISRSPIVTYSVDGQEYEIVGGYYSTSMKIGDNIKLLYDKNHNDKAVIKTGLWFAPLITGILGVVFVLPIPIFLILLEKGIISI